MSRNINLLLKQADNLRLKLLAIVGQNEERKKSLISHLKSNHWTLIDVESELLSLKDRLKHSEKDEEYLLISKELKQWFESKPNNVILTNASILYHSIFQKMSPIGAFKYRTRNKNAIIFLEDENILRNRISHSSIGEEDYYDEEIKDILMVNINDISNDFEEIIENKKQIKSYEKNPDAIGHLFNFEVIKDVIDIDTDLQSEESIKKIISSYIISESLENQILEVFKNLNQPKHKAVKIIGNYGSGKSHLIAFLVSIVSNPEFAALIQNDNLLNQAKSVRKYKIVQFELLSGDIEISKWFFSEIRKQLKEKYNIAIPKFSEEEFNHKDNLGTVLKIIKDKDPSSGLLVVIDEVSDFIAQKQIHAIKRDFGFLREVAQFCQANDLMVITSMQEDIYTNPKFKDISSNEERISERFQNIIIHKEDIRKVISQRIISKTDEQKHSLENKLSSFAEKNKDISNRIDEYIELFPLTPSLLSHFEEMPYFEKRGVIQFAQNEIKYILNKDFPFFLTFDYIFDVLQNNPNRSNLEEIYPVIKAVDIVRDKIITVVEKDLQEDALKITKGLAVNHIKSDGKTGMNIEELAEQLLIMPSNKIFSPKDYVLRIIKKIREATDGNYIKIIKDEKDGNVYLKFDLDKTIDYEERIEQKINTIGDDLVENEIFKQIEDILNPEKYQNFYEIYNDETIWKSVKSYRKGYLVFAKKGIDFQEIPQGDFAVVIVSPFRKKEIPKFSENQIAINFKMESSENTNRIKRVCAIKTLISNNIAKSVMEKKLKETIIGYTKGIAKFTGIKFRLAKTFYHICDYSYNAEPIILRKYVSKETSNLLELFEELKTNFFDSKFNEKYNLHPNYTVMISSQNSIETLSSFAREISRGNFSNLGKSAETFLNGLSLLNFQNFPDYSDSKIALKIIEIIQSQKNKLTDINKDLHKYFEKEPFGIEPEIINFYLLLLTAIGKIILKARGGDKIDLNNLKEKFKSMAQFETINYAQLHQNLSYDFAERLLNTIGLNGAMIRIEKNRIEIFKQYKEKIFSLKKVVADTSEIIGKIKLLPKIYLNIDSIDSAFIKAQSIKWDDLDINNYSQFSNIEHFNSRLKDIKSNLEKQKQIFEAASFYIKSLHSDIMYMHKAIDVLNSAKNIATATEKKTLFNFLNDVKNITSDIGKFLDNSERNPINGKVQSFRKKYVFDIYYPYHEKHIGKKANWSDLDSLNQNKTYKQLIQITKLNCLSSSKFYQKLQKWEALKKLRCFNLSTDELQNSPVCLHCYLPKEETDYSKVNKELQNIEDTLCELWEKYEKRAVEEITNYQDNLEIADIKPKHKTIINEIITAKKLPDSFDDLLIQSINKLFKEIEIVELDKKEILQKLFHYGEMISLEQFRKAFFELEDEIKKNKKEDEIRIKLK